MIKQVPLRMTTFVYSVVPTKIMDKCTRSAQLYSRKTSVRPAVVAKYLLSVSGVRIVMVNSRTRQMYSSLSLISAIEIRVFAARTAQTS